VDICLVSRIASRPPPPSGTTARPSHSFPFLLLYKVHVNYTFLLHRPTKSSRSSYRPNLCPHGTCFISTRHDCLKLCNGCNGVHERSLHPRSTPGWTLPDCRPAQSWLLWHGVPRRGHAYQPTGGHQVFDQAWRHGQPRRCHCRRGCGGATLPRHLAKSSSSCQSHSPLREQGSHLSCLGILPPRRPLRSH